MSRIVEDPSYDELMGLINEPVELHVQHRKDIPASTYRGILLRKEGQWFIRSFGGHDVLCRDDEPAGVSWIKVQRLEVSDISANHQQAWMAFEPLAAQLFVLLEASSSASPLSIF